MLKQSLGFGLAFACMMVAIAAGQMRGAQAPHQTRRAQVALPEPEGPAAPPSKPVASPAAPAKPPGPRASTIVCSQVTVTA